MKTQFQQLCLSKLIKATSFYTPLQTMELLAMIDELENIQFNCSVYITELIVGCHLDTSYATLPDAAELREKLVDLLSTMNKTEGAQFDQISGVSVLQTVEKETDLRVMYDDFSTFRLTIEGNVSFDGQDYLYNETDTNSSSGTFRQFETSLCSNTMELLAMIDELENIQFNCSVYITELIVGCHLDTSYATLPDAAELREKLVDLLSTMNKTEGAQFDQISGVSVSQTFENKTENSDDQNDFSDSRLTIEGNVTFNGQPFVWNKTDTNSSSDTFQQFEASLCSNIMQLLAKIDELEDVQFNCSVRIAELSVECRLVTNHTTLPDSAEIEEELSNLLSTANTTEGAQFDKVFGVSVYEMNSLTSKRKPHVENPENVLMQNYLTEFLQNDLEELTVLNAASGDAENDFSVSGLTIEGKVTLNGQPFNWNDTGVNRSSEIFQQFENSLCLNTMQLVAKVDELKDIQFNCSVHPAESLVGCRLISNDATFSNSSELEENLSNLLSTVNSTGGAKFDEIFGVSVYQMDSETTKWKSLEPKGVKIIENMEDEIDPFAHYDLENMGDETVADDQAESHQLFGPQEE